MRLSHQTITACLLVGLAACGGGGKGGAATAPSPVAEPGFVATSVQDALDYAVDNGIDGIWIYIDNGAATPTFKSAGTQDRGSLAPAELTALFKIASISKMFIAVSSTKLVHDGTLKLNDTLAFWLPSLSGRIENANTITIRHLLQHRSGVADFDSQAGFRWDQPHTDTETLLDFALDKPADFAPDFKYEYSNTNYLLLGMILDTALGYNHHAFVQNAILSPLGMVNTSSLMTNANAALLARGYWDGVDRTEQDYVAPGGSMVSTAEEIGIFLRALATGPLLSDPERQTYESLFDGYGHSGWLPGYQSIARFHAGSNTVLVQFVNTTGGNSEAISQTVYDSLFDFLRNN